MRHPPNSVVRHVRDFHDEPLGVVAEPHDGTEPGIRSAASRVRERIDEEYGGGWSNMASYQFATDAQGRPAWAISPNLKHIARAGTPQARYISGDLLDRLGASQGELSLDP